LNAEFAGEAVGSLDDPCFDGHLAKDSLLREEGLFDLLLLILRLAPQSLARLRISLILLDLVQGHDRDDVPDLPSAQPLDLQNRVQRLLPTDLLHLKRHRPLDVVTGNDADLSFFRQQTQHGLDVSVLNVNRHLSAAIDAALLHRGSCRWSCDGFPFRCGRSLPDSGKRQDVEVYDDVAAFLPDAVGNTFLQGDRYVSPLLAAALLGSWFYTQKIRG